jgi:hypothetical protein
MKTTLAVFVGLFFAIAVRAQAPTPKEEPPPSAIKGAIAEDSNPCQRCGNEHSSMPFFDRRWPPLYRPGVGDCVRSPNAVRDTGRLTWWFVPTPRALVQAICP